MKRNIKTICNCSNGTRDSHSAYSMMLRTAGVNMGFVLFVMQRFTDWCIWQMHPQLCMHKEPRGCRFRESHRELFETLTILPHQSQIHTFLLLFVANNRINSKCFQKFITQIQKKNLIFTNLHKIYHHNKFHSFGIKVLKFPTSLKE